ncbi:HIRAN domain-containing protein [Endozoicomonas euniceicola]|uniref:HIRAN domain-containing protein n=1 Tax=Endozoicomonas euniceicola TaxID=1234143 RepID=A0ABY6GRB1_9GAMM|nr:HIRAN domain-containing protein [Endozoicomonas euniceicola]UYM15291.1 HIRAN domain-containing protein [Endozoicomonas euniceicola]
MRSQLNSVFLAWQDPKERSWHTVGKLTQNNQLFEFHYTRGALTSEAFIPFTGMNDLQATYQSDSLFPLFANRVLSERRPEYKKLLSWLGLADEKQSPIVILSKTGGIKSTDNLQVFPEGVSSPEKGFEIDFFAHGLLYITDSARSLIKSLKVGDKLLLMEDVQNEHGGLVMAVRTSDTPEIIGYCPRFLADRLSDAMDAGAELDLSIARVNANAPLYYQLMCNLKTGAIPAGTPFKNDEFLKVPDKIH